MATGPGAPVPSTHSAPLAPEPEAQTRLPCGCFPQAPPEPSTGGTHTARGPALPGARSVPKTLRMPLPDEHITPGGRITRG